jgi:uncharacterized protein with PQ loop repeat
MPLTEIAGYVGAALAGAAYVPQISHMVRERCVAGISRPAFLVWFVASALILVRAIATDEMVFVVLGSLQTGATGFISLYVAAHRGCYCHSHAVLRPSPPARR